MTKSGKRRAANCVYHIGASIKDLGKKWFGFSKMEILTPDELVIEDKKKSEFLLSMEELFRYYLRNIIILRIGTGLRYLWLRFVRHRKISYRTLYEGSKSKKTSELSNFENEMSNRAWGCGFILFVIFLIIFLRRFL